MKWIETEENEYFNIEKVLLFERDENVIYVTFVMSDHLWTLIKFPKFMKIDMKKFLQIFLSVIEGLNQKVVPFSYWKDLILDIYNKENS